MKKTAGFTLVELLVTIAVSSTVLLAAASLLLLGVRVYDSAREDAGEQQTVRIVLSMLEDVAASGSIYRVEPMSNGWRLQGRDDAGDAGPELLRYENGSLLSGDAVLLDGLWGARAELTEEDLLTFTFRTEKHEYSTAVYCRTGVLGDSAGSTEDAEKIIKDIKTPEKFPTLEGLTETEKAARYAFLQTLADQYGSKGQIIGGTQYFSEWYIGGYGESHPGWNEYTPWCACFLSWAAAQYDGNMNSTPPRFAEVDIGMKYFQDYRDPTDSEKGFWAEGGSAYTPIPGDYIFFDWSGGDDPDHVGAVLCVQDGYVFTIEGNSAGKVAVQKYDLTDDRIVGYGILDWKKGSTGSES